MSDEKPAREPNEVQIFQVNIPVPGRPLYSQKWELVPLSAYDALQAELQKAREEISGFKDERDCYECGKPMGIVSRNSEVEGFYISYNQWECSECETAILSSKQSHEVDRTVISKLKADRDAAIKERDELKGVLDLKNDEYVKQVGTWKVIQRLEEERDSLRADLKIATDALESICDSKCAIGINPCEAREALEKVKAGKSERCKHGVWKHDRCWECDPNIGQVKL
jgi:hypothetical protein